MNCRIRKRKDDTARILLETTTHPRQASFVTLTYNDNNLPVTGEYVPTLEKKKTLKWVNNVQRKIGNFRYYIVGEYGDESGRPHYHMGLFPTYDAQVAMLTREWPHGFTSAYPMSPGTAQYLAAYTTKKLTSSSDERLLPGQEPEFRTSSRRPPLGHAFVAEVVAQYRTVAGRKVTDERGDIEKTFRYQGTVYPLPKYVIRKAREALGIPPLHEQRMCHPGYFELHCNEEHATWEPTIAKIQENQHHAKEKAKRTRPGRRVL